MILVPKTAAGRWLWLIICFFSITLAIYFVGRFSKDRTHSKIAAANPKLGSIIAAMPRAPALQITSVIQHGHIIEIEGSTDPGAVVMINGETVSTIEGTSFRHFLGPLPSGTTLITVTSQDDHGGVTTKRMATSLE